MPDSLLGGATLHICRQMVKLMLEEGVGGLGGGVHSQTGCGYKYRGYGSAAALMETDLKELELCIATLHPQLTLWVVIGRSS